MNRTAFQIYGLKKNVIPPIPEGTIQICDQVWTTKNLDVTTYRDGTEIPQATTDADWIAKGNAGIGAWCYYANNSANGPIYGKLYNWYAVNDARGLAPTGYHVPTDAEWSTLTNTCLGGESVAGGKMKTTGTIEAGTGLWQDPNSGATNSSGFSGLPGGVRSSSGPFINVGNYGFWWSSSESNTTNVWARFMAYSSGNAFRLSVSKILGYSVRLIKD
jgi:uncharacterized protein (TIGR02145 family)